MFESVPQADAEHVGVPQVTPDESPVTVAVRFNVCCWFIVGGLILGVILTEIGAAASTVITWLAVLVGSLTEVATIVTERFAVRFPLGGV